MNRDAERKIALIGVPTSAASFAPGQERAPAALREAGLIATLQDAGWDVEDWGDLPEFRWRPDRQNPRAQHVGPTVATVRSVRGLTARAVSSGFMPLVLGGNCTIELGVVAGLQASLGRPGLVYFDRHLDLNTPDTILDGALDWMVVAHALDAPGAVVQLAGASGPPPLMNPDEIAFFGTEVGDCTKGELDRVKSLEMLVVKRGEVAASAAVAARALLNGWGTGFGNVAIHLDVDVVDFTDLPLSEETSRNRGLSFEDTVDALRVFVQDGRTATLTVTELNPDHGEPDGASIRKFVEGLGTVFNRARI